MRCPRCQHENEAGAKFCEECAAPLAGVCARCGRPLSATAKFCPECAHPTGLSAEPPPTPRFGSPDAYTPKHLAEKILTSKSALEGERKQVTVLFADLKGSMELLADRDPEEARKLLDPVLERMMEAVHRYEGTVNQVMGDGIMALFGAPLAHEDHAVRACYAALWMQDAIRRYTEEVRRTQGIEVQIRVGLNSGDVVVRSIGSDLRMDYTAVGQTTHLAARMEQLAPPGATRLTAETLLLAEGFVQVKPLGPIHVKGLAEPVEIFELVGAAAVRTRLQAARARGFTRFVGRDTEMEQIRQAVEQARRGRGQIVAVVGEPGVGKSRLFYEFLHSHHVHQWLVLEASSVSYGKVTPFLPLVDLLRAYFRIDDRDDTRSVRAKLTGTVLTLDRALEDALPAILWLLDALPPDDHFVALEPAQRRRRAIDGAKRLLMRESCVQPLLLVFEDLHWVDAETQAMLDSLVESLPTAPVLLAVNYRPEYHHGWGSKTYYRQLRIDPLPAESADELLRTLLGDDASVGPLKPLLIQRTEGNPLFLEESVRTLVETRGLVGEPGAYRLAKAADTIQIPATVQAILAARIDRLRPELKRLLQAASVIGKDVPVTLLEAIADSSGGQLREALADLQTAEFLYEARLFPDLEYTFKHALTHEVAYGSLLQERRRALHTKIGEVLERLYPGRLAEQIERLAHHALKGEVWGKAVSYLRQAGTKAASRNAPREAVVWFEQALDALRRCPEDDHADREAIDLRLELQSALLPGGDVASVLRYLGEAEVLAEELNDQGRLGRVLAHQTFGFWWTGDLDRAVEAGQRAVAIATARADLYLAVVTNLRLGQVYSARGEYRRAINYFQNVAELVRDRPAEPFGLPDLPSVTCRDNMAYCLAVVGDFGSATAAVEEGLGIAKSCDNRYSLALAYRGVALPHLLRGDFTAAARQLERSVDVCETEGFSGLLSLVAPHLGKAYAMSGRVAEGMSLLERTAPRSASLNLMANRSRNLTWLGQSYLIAGRLPDAMECARRAVEFAETHNQRGHLAEATWLVGEISATESHSNTPSAEDALRAALALAEELGMGPLVAHCHAGLAKLYRRTGQRTEADEHFAAATSMYREMGMTYWLEKTEAEQKT